MQQHMFNIAYEDMNGVSVILDTESSIIHVLEVDNGFESHIEDALEQIKKSIYNITTQYANSCQIKKWYLYDMQGQVSLYHDELVEQVALNHPEVNQHFAGKMKMRQVVAFNKQ